MREDESKGEAFPGNDIGLARIAVGVRRTRKVTLVAPERVVCDFGDLDTDGLALGELSDADRLRLGVGDGRLPPRRAPSA